MINLGVFLLLKTSCLNQILPSGHLMEDTCLKGIGLNFSSWFWSHFLSLGIWVIWPRVFQNPQLSLGSKRIKSIPRWAFLQGSSQNTALQSLLPHGSEEHPLCPIPPGTWVSPGSSSSNHPLPLTFICKVSWFHFGFPFHFHSPHPAPLNSRINANVPHLDCLSSLLTSLPSSIALCDAFYFVPSSQVCFLKYRPNSSGLELKLLVILIYKSIKAKPAAQPCEGICASGGTLRQG